MLNLDYFFTHVLPPSIFIDYPLGTRQLTGNWGSRVALDLPRQGFYPRGLSFARHKMGINNYNTWQRVDYVHINKVPKGTEGRDNNSNCRN